MEKSLQEIFDALPKEKQLRIRVRVKKLEEELIEFCNPAGLVDYSPNIEIDTSMIMPIGKNTDNGF